MSSWFHCLKPRRLKTQPPPSRPPSPACTLQVQRLVWLPGGVIAACAHVDSKEAGGAAQLLLYPRHHLDTASLMARAPLHQVSRLGLGAIFGAISGWGQSQV